MIEISNRTPHPIVLRTPEGQDVTYPTSGTIARVASTPGERIAAYGHVPVFESPQWGEVDGLPPENEYRAQMPGYYTPTTIYIVSLLVAQRCAGRRDVVSPGTGPNDGAIRDEKGQVVAVTRFVLPPR